MPNPQGVNSFNRFAPEPVYGEKIQQRKLEQMAPVPRNPALNAPDRARQPQPQPTQPQPAPSPQETPMLPPGQLYRGIADIPGASDTVRRIFGG